DRWNAEGREVFYRPVSAQPATFLGQPRSELRATRHDVEATTLQLLDVRSVEEFRGDDPSSARAGHIPGATNITWLDFVSRDETLFKDSEAVRELLKTSSLNPDRGIIAY